MKLILPYKELQGIDFCWFCREIKPIKDGFGTGSKYFIKTKKNEKLLIKIVDITLYEVKKLEYEFQIVLQKTGIPIQPMIGFGICNHGKSVFQAFSWIEGKPLDKILPRLEPVMQYNLGMRAGMLLKEIHSQIYEEKFFINTASFTLRKKECLKDYQRYRSSGADVFIGDVFAEYVERHCLDINLRRASILHGDYHVGNMIMGTDDNIYVIDWVYGMIGDPWEDFVRIVVSAEVSPYFSGGQIDGYFKGNPTDEFWDRLAFYIAMHQLDILQWHFPLMDNGESFQKHQHEHVIKEYDGMKSNIPLFYKNNSCKGGLRYEP